MPSPIQRAERSLAPWLAGVAAMLLSSSVMGGFFMSGCLLNRAGGGAGGLGGEAGLGGQGGGGADGGSGGMSSAGGQSMGGSPPCGNGTLDDGEACDDGNTDDGDGCSAMCMFDASDACPPSSQITLLPGVEVQQIGTTFEAANDIDPACGTELRPDVVYQVLPAETGILQVVLTGSFDRVLYIRDGCPAVDLVCEPLPGGVNTIERLPVLGDKPYLVFVDANVADAASTFSLSMVLLNCGDGLLDETEECDDGNQDNDDGCSDTCVVECDGGFKRSDHHCYRYFSAETNWNQARTNCLALGPGYDLIAISSSGERSYVDGTIDPSVNMWTGGNDQLVEGTFEWTNGEPFRFNGFGSGEPNGGTDENCIEFIPAVGNDYFNDLSCNQARDYVCELTPAGS